MELKNIDTKTVDSFGDEWARFSQEALEDGERKFLFECYFDIFPWDQLAKDSEGFDMGCGSGIWAVLVAPKVGKLTCIDPSLEALEVARRNLKGVSNISFVHAGVADAALPLDSQDFGYSLGVLHHISDTASALKDCIRFLKPGSPFLVYLYYRFDNRPYWYSLVWRVSDVLRRGIYKLTPTAKTFTTNLIVALVYFPLVRIARLAEILGLTVDGWLLSSYRDTSFYTMRTDSRDRFGTPLEQRFTKAEIIKMMKSAGLEDIQFSDEFPFWCAVGRKTQDPV